MYFGAADMKGEGHGFRNYSHLQQHALGGIHLFHRQPHLAYMTNDDHSTAKGKPNGAQSGAETNRRC
jgi:hypothetical protein